MGLGLAPTSTIGTRNLLPLGPVVLAAKLGAALTQWVYIYAVMGPAELNKPGWELIIMMIYSNIKNSSNYKNKKYNLLPMVTAPSKESPQIV